MPHQWLEKRRLGEILVERGLLTDGGLRRALEEQARTGRLIGEILIERGWITAEELADALAEQEVPGEGAEVEPRAEPQPRRPQLGRLLVDKGLISPEVLDVALSDQRLNWRPLGQILVGMGVLTEEDLGRTLTEQHGFDFSRGLRARLAPDCQVGPLAPADEPSKDEQTPDETYVVREPGSATPFHVAGGLLDAADVAFELIEEVDPAELEIVRTSGGRLEVVWSYDRETEPGELSARLQRERDPIESGDLSAALSELIGHAGEDHLRLEEQ